MKKFEKWHAEQMKINPERQRDADKIIADIKAQPYVTMQDTDTGQLKVMKEDNARVGFRKRQVKRPSKVFYFENNPLVKD